MAAFMGPSKPTQSSIYQYKYKQNPDGSIGVDYFLHGNPVTNTQFAQGTGLDTNAIENGTGATAINNMAVNNIPGQPGSQYNPPTQTPTQTPTGGGTPAPAPDQYDKMFGVQHYYNENDYTNAVNDQISKTYKTNVGNINDLFQSGLINLEMKDKLIGQTRDTLSTQHTKALGQITGMFSAAAPDVVSSQEANYKNAANTDYTKQTDQLGAPLGQPIQNYSPDQLSQYSNNLTDVGGMVRDYINLGKGQQQNLASNDQWKSNALDASGNNLIDYQMAKANMQPTTALSGQYSPISSGISAGTPSATDPGSVTGYTVPSTVPTGLSSISQYMYPTQPQGA